MEALIILIAPLLELMLAPFLALAGAMLGLIVEAVLWLLALLFGGAFAARRAARKAERPGDTPAVRKPLVPRRVLHWGAGLMLAAGLAVVLASFLFLDPILRYALARAGEKSGVAIAYEGARGNLLAGRVALDGVTMRRAAGRGLDFDLSAHEVEVDVALLSLLDGEVRIEAVKVAGVRGQIVPPQRDKESSGAGEGGRRKKRAFRIDDLRVEDAALDVAPRDRAGFAMVIAQAEVAPLRSRTALFDLLFRSNLRAEVAGQPLLVETRQITEYGRETHWRFENVEAAKLRLILPRAPLTWLGGGRFSAVVDDRWSLSEDWIEMDWRIAFEGIEVDLPAPMPPVEAALARAFQKRVEAAGGDATFRYKITLDQEQIALAREGDLDGFWKLLLTGFVKESAKGILPRPGEALNQPAGAEERTGGMKGALGKVRDLLKRD